MELNENNNQLNEQVNTNDYKDLNEELSKLEKKNKKLKTKNIILIIIALICAGFLSFLYLNFGMYFKIFLNKKQPNTKQSYVKEMNGDKTVATNSSINEGSLDIDNIKEKLSLIDDYVNMFFYYDKDNKKIEDEIFKGYVKALGDKYAEYMPAKTYDDFVETQSGEYYGIGAVVSQDPDTKEAKVNEVYEGSPAEKAGVKVDDIIKTVDGKDVSQNELSDIVDMIKGEEGTSVLIGFYRPSAGKIVELNCIRGKVEVKRVAAEIKEPNIGYLKVSEFTGKSLEQFKSAVDNLTDEKAKGLIIDLRNDPGGELNIVLDMLDYVLKDNDGKYTLNQVDDKFTIGRTLLVYMKDRKTIVDAYYCDDNHQCDLPIVILTNEASASASELFTEALRDYNKATIVGNKTYGKGVMQNLIPLGDGSAIKFTVSGYFPPSGFDIDKHGIIPDYSLDEDGTKVHYTKTGDAITKDDKGNDVKITSKGAVKIKNIASISNTFFVGKKYSESLDITSEKFKYKNEAWFKELDKKYDDKQLLQAFVILKEK